MCAFHHGCNLSGFGLDAFFVNARIALLTARIISRWLEEGARYRRASGQEFPGAAFCTMSTLTSALRAGNW